MHAERRAKYERALLIFARAVTVGAAYVLASPIPGLTSSFVAIFIALLPFDIIVASEKPLTRLRDSNHIFQVLRPRVLATANTLVKGIVIGATVGILCIAGLPTVIGAVLTAGLAYIWALGTPYLVSTYVSILSGLSLFHRLVALEFVHPTLIVRETLTAIVVSGGGTFAALVAGWGVGMIVGIFTRLFLSRPYRSLKSSAYDLPLEMRPFNEVLHVGQKSLVVSVTVEEAAPLAHVSLAESRLRDEWQTTVLSIKRDGNEQVMPKGTEVLRPGDELLLLTDREASPELYQQFKAPELSGDHGFQGRVINE